VNKYIELGKIDFLDHIAIIRITAISINENCFTKCEENINVLHSTILNYGLISICEVACATASCITQIRIII